MRALLSKRFILAVCAAVAAILNNEFGALAGIIAAYVAGETYRPSGTDEP
jgi:hypothetical protein